jgi:hypothetical protein
MSNVAIGVGRILGHLGLAIGAVWLVSPIVPFYSPFPDIVQTPPSRAQLAFQTLQEADRLYAAQIGYGGTAPPELLAWRLILHTPDRDSLFLELARSPSRVAQLYGLIGLYLVNPSFYARAATALARDGSSVPIMIGCIAWDTPMAVLLAEIDEGLWTREFLTGQLRR